MTATNGIHMDLSHLNAKHLSTGRSARMLVMLCFVVAGVILAASLLFPPGSSALVPFAAMPR